MKFKVCYKFTRFFNKQQSKNSGLNVSWFLQLAWLCLIFQFLKQKGKLFQIRQKIDKTHHCAVDLLLRRKVSVEIKATAAPLFSLGRTAINKHHQHLRWKFATIIEKSKYIAIDWPLIYSLPDKVSWSIIRYIYISCGHVVRDFESEAKSRGNY